MSFFITFLIEIKKRLYNLSYFITAISVSFICFFKKLTFLCYFKNHIVIDILEKKSYNLDENKFSENKFI